jgi:hypothetical protein
MDNYARVDEDSKLLLNAKNISLNQSRNIKWHFVYFSIVASLNHALAYGMNINSKELAGFYILFNN